MLSILSIVSIPLINIFVYLTNANKEPRKDILLDVFHIANQTLVLCLIRFLTFETTRMKQTIELFVKHILKYGMNTFDLFSTNRELSFT